MATRADFYIQSKNGELEFLGSTVNDYDGGFEESKTIQEFRENVLEKLEENNSIEGKWYWSWNNSVVTDEVFIFKNTPSFFNKNKGVLYCKTYHKDKDYNGNLLAFIPYRKRYIFEDDEGCNPENMLTFIEMPNLKLKE